MKKFNLKDFLAHLKEFLTRNLKAVISAAIVIFSLAVIFCYFGINGFCIPYREAKITVEQGQSAYSVISELKENGIIKSEIFMKLNYKSAVKKDGFSIKSGTATFNSHMSYGEILNILSSDMRPEDFVLTIPEGYETVQIAAAVQKVCGISREEFLAEIADGDFDYPFITDSLPAGQARLEGYLFPDTYFIGREFSAHDIIDLMLARFEEAYTDEYAKQAENLGYTTHEIITLASIIERECSADHELVSSVFHNRLKSNEFSYLESCATVIYVTKQPKDRLTYKDINVDSPYNTYLNKGLPPGPIASPGKTAINAALYPAQSDYFYFSADGNGKNSFSKTYEEHLAKNNGGF